MIKTSVDLIAEVKLSASLPVGDSRFSDVRILQLADSEIQSVILPILMAAREEYLSVSESILVASGDCVRVPYRAVASIISEVRTNGRPIPFIQASDAWQWEAGSGAPKGYTLLGDSLQLLPKEAQGTIQVSYFIRPSRLVKPSNCATILSVNPGLGAIVLNAALPLLSPGMHIDFISARSSNSILAWDILPLNIAATLIEVPTGDGKWLKCLRPGDYVSLAETSPVIPIPQEGFTLLAQSIVSRCLESLMDTEGLQLSLAKQSQKAAQFKELLNPRNHTTAKVTSKAFFGNRGGAKCHR